MIINFNQFSGLIQQLTDLKSAEITWRNDLELVSSVTQLNEARSIRLSNFRRAWDGTIYYVLNEPDNYKCLSLAQGCYDGNKINYQDMQSGPGNRSVGPIIMTNNQLAQLMRTFDSTTLSNIRFIWGGFPFVVHDFDNHHWYQVTFFAQVFADFYFPAHPNIEANLSADLLSIQQPIPIGSIQWESNFLENNKLKIIRADRSDRPLGRHNYYEKFKIRNRTIATLNQYFDDVKINFDQEYEHTDTGNRLLEWCGRKLHFIAPVNGDIPIRFYDAIITGGLPLIPKSLESAVRFFEVPEEHYVTYEPRDIFTPQPLVKEAIEKFDERGYIGVANRVNFGLYNLHVDATARKMLHRVQRAITIR
jgi:hypothetical protein